MKHAGICCPPNRFLFQESAAWFNLGNIETKLENYKRALEAYEIAADLSPGIAGYRLREANSLFQVWPALSLPLLHSTYEDSSVYRYGLSWKTQSPSSM